jgi:hypothetical protein
MPEPLLSNLGALGQRNAFGEGGAEHADTKVLKTAVPISRLKNFADAPVERVRWDHLSVSTWKNKRAMAVMRRPGVKPGSNRRAGTRVDQKIPPANRTCSWSHLETCLGIDQLSQPQRP